MNARELTALKREIAHVIRPALHQWADACDYVTAVRDGGNASHVTMIEYKDGLILEVQITRMVGTP